MSQAARYIGGIHGVRAALTHRGDDTRMIWFDPARKDRRLGQLLAAARKQGIETIAVERAELDRMVSGSRHQGVVARVSSPVALPESALEELLTRLQQPPLLLALDGIQDPHNLGACLRTADAAGVHAVIAPRDRAVGLTPVVSKVASGAAETLPFIQVTNLARTLEGLRRHYGLWVVGLAGEAEHSLYQADLRGPLAIVMGNEEKGLRRLTREHCDSLLSLPMQGSVASLNVSAATAVSLFEAVRQRHAVRENAA